MNTFVIDIETTPQNYESLDGAKKEYLMKYAKNDEERAIVKQQMALWAPTNTIVAIGILSVEQKKGAVYFHNDGGEAQQFVEGPIRYRSGSEKEILQMFWHVMRTANKFVTFNGRRFDCPVLMQKSAMLGIRPTKNLMPYRFSKDIHIDLLEQMTFYGAARKFNLDVFCKAFGIDSPKSHGITGHDVAPLFAEGKFTEIAQYCGGDLWATRELYLKWNEYLAF